MELDKHLNDLPLTRTHPHNLQQFFGSTEMLPMWVADMEFAVSDSIQKALTERITGSGFAYEYRPDAFFTALKKWYAQRYHLEISKEEIIFSPSITSSIALILEQLTETGDGVIIQPPVFMEFRDVIRKTRRTVIKNPLKKTEGRYSIDFDDLREKAGQPNTKALILCSPHNPVGRVWSKEELEQVITICKEQDIYLIADEIHKDIILFNNRFTSALQFRDRYEKILVCTSEAKTFNLPGISDSMLIIPDTELRTRLSKIFKRYNLGRTNALTRVAQQTAYEKGGPWLDELVATIENNIRLIENTLKKSGSKIRLQRPEGTYQVWLDFSALFDDSKKMFQVITQKSGVAMNAGHWFGREGALYMRMNIGTSGEKVQLAIDKIINAEKEL